MTWGAIGYTGRTPIAFLEGNQDSQCYQRTLERSLLRYLDQIVDGMLFSNRITVQYTLLLPPADGFWIINSMLLTQRGHYSGVGWNGSGFHQKVDRF